MCDEDRNYILQQVTNMRWVSQEREFLEKWEHLQQYCGTKGMAGFVDYFTSQYISRWKLWTAAGDPLRTDWGAVTNNLLEVRYACVM